MQLSTTMFMKQKNVGLVNYRVSFKCKLQHTMFMKQKNVVTKTTGKVLNANSTSMFMKQQTFYSLLRIEEEL